MQLPNLPKFVLKPPKLQLLPQPQQQRQHNQHNQQPTRDNTDRGNRLDRGSGSGDTEQLITDDRSSKPGVSTHKSVPTSRSGSPRFSPYASPDTHRRGKSGADQTGDSQILFRLQSPVPHGPAGVVPGVPTTVPVPPVPVPEERDSVVGPDSPRIVRTDVPLGKQGWASHSSSRPVPDQEPGSPVPDVRADPSAPEETSSPEKAHSPRAATRGARKTSADPVYENLEFSARPGHSRGARPKEAVVQQPKSILKKSEASTTKKSVQYTPSTKRGRPVSTKRPPTPDLEVSIRPTSNWDIVDEVLAGQPTKTVAGRTIPDTLIQISEPTPHDQAKKSKKTIIPSDRTLRSKK